MRSLKYLFLVVIIACNRCAHAQKIKFLQADVVYAVGTNDIDSITIDRKPFSLRYFCKQYDEAGEKFYSAQIAVLENEADLKAVKMGAQSATIPFFEPGTGMAPGTNGMYDTMVISNAANHYLTYENDTAKRTYLVTKGKDDLELEWKISAVTYQGKDLSFSALPLDHFYFVIFIDHNLNQIIDAGELTIVKVKLK